MSLFKNQTKGTYIKTGEKFSLRFLETPFIRTSKSGKKYLNFNKMQSYHSTRGADGSFRKIPCTNPYNNEGTFCFACQEYGDIRSRSYSVEVQPLWSENCTIEGEDMDRYEYNSDMSLNFEAQNSLTSALLYGFNDVSSRTGVTLDRFKYIVFTIEKTAGAPWYRVLDARYEPDMPLPTVRPDYGEPETKNFVPAGVAHTNFDSPVAPKVTTGISIASFTPAEIAGIKDIADQIREYKAEGETVTTEIIEQSLLNSVITGASDEEREHKAYFAAYNMFDKDANLCVDL